MMALVGTVFVASLVGSTHCAGMCGGFVAFCAGTDRASASLATYHLTRLAVYALLGVGAGALGTAVDLAGRAAGLQSIAAIAAALVMIGWGAARLLHLHGRPLPVPRWLAQASTRVLRHLHGKPPLVRAALVGLATGLLPCGWLYTFAVMAAGTGRPTTGALVMTVFWAGTLPMLTAVGLGIRAATGPLARRLPMITALAVVVAGFASLAMRLPALIQPAGHTCCHHQASEP
jgi:sulfite exporter TauE/SafE